MGLTGLAKTFAGELVRRLDSWENSLTGLGTSRDKRIGHAFFVDAILQPEELENLYHGDDMAARAVGKIVEEALRKGIELSVDGDDAGDAKDDIKRVQADLDRLGFLDALGEAAEWGRLFGGGALLIGAKGSGMPQDPLDDERVTAVEYLNVLDRRDLRPLRYYQDPLSPRYGKPELYLVAPLDQANGVIRMSSVVHETRVIIFDGVRTSKRKRRENYGWSHSVLQRMYDVLRDFNASWGSVAHLTQDASQGVYKLKGFLELIASGDTADFDTRMQMLDRARSVAQCLVVDADAEGFERQATSFSGLPDVLDRMVQRMAAAAGMPVTKLMGISPAGLNATGEHDESGWYDSVAAYQQNTLKPPAQRIVRLVARSMRVEPSTLNVCFPPLKQMTPAEQATLRKTTFEADAIAIDKGIYLAEEVALVRSKGGKFSADEPVVDLAVRKAALEAELEHMEASAGQPDPAPPTATPPVMQSGEEQPQETEVPAEDR